MASSEVLASLAVKISAQSQEFERALERTQKKLNSTASSIDSTTKEISGTFKGMAGAIAGAFALDSISSFGSKVIELTSEFQKFEAVLTNTLGSNSAAQQAMIRLQEFASRTPFGVREITEEFVKLANRGISVTNGQLTKIGDVAAALGKPLGKVNEAILDISNTERWNELGIKVKTEGDKIIGTFKGMTVEAEKTEKGALSMIEQFGEMEGVAGGMAAVSATLGGKLSNLSDNFDKLFTTIGNGSSGVLSGAVDLLNDYVNWVNNAFKSTEQINLEKITPEVEAFAKVFAETNEQMQKIAAERVVRELNELKAAYASATGEQKENTKLLLDIKQGELDAIKSYYANIQKEREADAAKEAKTRSEALAKLQAAQQQALNAFKADLSNVEKNNIAFGDSYDYIGQKAAVLQKGIENLITNGFAPQGKVVQDYLSQLNSLGTDQQFDLGRITPIDTGQFDIMKAGFTALAETNDTLLTPSLHRVAAGIGSIAVTAPSAADVFQGAMAESADYAMQFGGVIGSMNGLLQGFGEAMLDTAFTGANFGEGILQAVSEFAANFGKQVVALGVAKLGLDNLFKFPGAAPAAIAGGIALMAVAKALSAASAKNLSSATAGGGGYGGSSRVSTTPGGFGIPREPVEIVGKTEITNKAIVISYENGKKTEKRTT